MDYTGLGIAIIFISITVIIVSIIFAKYIYILGLVVFYAAVHYLYAVFVGRENGNEFEVGDETGEEFYVQTLSGGQRID